MQQSQNVSAASSSVNNPIFQPLKVLISESVVLSKSPCMGPTFTIEHGVPKEVAEAMVEQIIQEQVHTQQDASLSPKIFFVPKFKPKLNF